MKKSLCRMIAGEITLSEDPGASMRMWRERFQVSQREVAIALGVSPSVISDYESGRRLSPRIDTVQKFVRCLVELDEARGGTVINGLLRMMGNEIPSDVILDIKEFSYPVKAEFLCTHLKCEILANEDLLEQPIYGYTAIDVVNAILKLSSEQLVLLYGATPQRAAIFANVTSGRASMVAIKTSKISLSNIKPTAVILHGLKKLDPLALKIAESERILLAASTIKDVKNLVKALRDFMPHQIT
ncbi:MAG: helix-turn-helix domain-containing protein [Candidatus Freyarchaeota archaeon]|nr:helix-turn-helix domain-containing protein [Candidatus Jordarchaeia archaeon]